MKAVRPYMVAVGSLFALAMGAFITSQSMGQAQPAAPASAPAAKKQVLSQVVNVAQLPRRDTGVGNRRDLFDGPTVTLDTLEGHITVLNPGQASHAPHQHINEEVIVLIEGNLDVSINGKISKAEKGDVLFFSSNDWHAVNNTGTVPALYYVFNWKTPVRAGMSPSTAPNPATQPAPR
jgi:XRE family transcriptional regulator, regulator of sulfur utilization